jgi:hypothetical protein
MINEHDIRDLHEENKDKQPKPAKKQPQQLSLELEITPTEIKTTVEIKDAENRDQ